MPLIANYKRDEFLIPYGENDHIIFKLHAEIALRPPSIYTARIVEFDIHKEHCPVLCLFYSKLSNEARAEINKICEQLILEDLQQNLYSYFHDSDVNPTETDSPLHPDHSRGPTQS